MAAYISLNRPNFIGKKVRTRGKGLARTSPATAKRDAKPVIEKRIVIEFKREILSGKQKTAGNG